MTVSGMLDREKQVGSTVRGGKKVRETGHKAPIPHHIALPHQSDYDSDVDDDKDGKDDGVDTFHHQSQRGRSPMRR